MAPSQNAVQPFQYCTCQLFQSYNLSRPVAMAAPRTITTDNTFKSAARAPPRPELPRPHGRDRDGLELFSNLLFSSKHPSRGRGHGRAVCGQSELSLYNLLPYWDRRGEPRRCGGWNMENVKYCVHRYPLLFMRAEYLKFPVAWKMFNTKFSIKC